MAVIASAVERPYRGKSRNMVVPPTALDELRLALGPENVTVHPEALHRAGENTLGAHRLPAAIVQPASTRRVQEVVRIANRHGLPLYPVSRGRSLGYGDRAPVRNGQVLVDLSLMNRIRSFDQDSGTLVVEPGVTQGQVHRLLAESGSRWWMDATGSGIESSMVGNTLEGGFGHTPVGNRRQLIAGVEAVLGDGTLLSCGRFPSLGPDLNRIFVQSNFAIVTAIDVVLLAAAERYRSFIARVATEDDLSPLIDRLARLRRDGTLTSLVHVANATRSLVSALGTPQSFRGRTIRNASAAAFMSTPIAKAGLWTAVGGLYGSRRLVAAKASDLRESLRGIATVRFFGDRGIALLRRVLAATRLSEKGGAATLRMAAEALEYVHGLGRGVPSDRGVEGELARAAAGSEPGLFWCSPTFEASGCLARQVVDLAERLFERSGFDLPITLTFVTPSRMIATMSCSFDRGDPDERDRAHELLSRLHEEYRALGIEMYREGILSMDRITHSGRGRVETLRKVKRALDPLGVVAPGRYGAE